MLRTLNSIICQKRSVLNHLERPDTSPFIQLVRWRKRRWAPIPASKIFYVRQPTPIDPDEWLELRNRTCEYTIVKKAIRRMFVNEEQSEAMQLMKERMIEEKELHHERMMTVNEQWNIETGRQREASLKKEEDAEREAILKVIARLQKQREEQKETARKIVMQEKLESRSFVSAENMEEEIEKALNTRVNYNYAIDFGGNKYIEQADASLEKEHTESEVAAAS